jgi:hypothetical protein
VTIPAEYTQPVVVHLICWGVLNTCERARGALHFTGIRSLFLTVRLVGLIVSSDPPTID